MLFANLRTALKIEVKPAYVLTGTDIFLINKSIELILQAAQIDPMNVARLDETADETEVQASVRNVSMFGGGTAVVVRGGMETRVVLQPDAKPKDIERVDCNPMTADVVVKLINNQIVAAGKKITMDAATMLAAACENNYARVDNEIQKLLNYFNEKPTIERADVNEIVTKTESFQIYELGNACLKKDTATADKILQNLISSGIDEYAIFGNLVSFIRRLFYALCSNTSDATVAGFLKVHPYAITASRRDGRHLRGKIADIYGRALELEYEIKSGKILAGRAVFLLQGLLI